MIALNATPQNGFDILSLIGAPGTPADSTNPLSPTQGFGSILTEMIGLDAAAPAASTASLAVASPASTNSSAPNAVDLSAFLSATTGSASMAPVQSVPDMKAPVSAESTTLSAQIAQTLNLQQPQTTVPAAAPGQPDPGQLLPVAARPVLPNPATKLPPLPGSQNPPVGSNDQQAQAQQADQQTEESVDALPAQLAQQLQSQKPQPSQKSQKSQDAQDPQKAQDPQSAQTSPTALAPFISVVTPSIAMEQKPVAAEDARSHEQQKSIDPATLAATAAAPAPVPLEMQRAWADLKKFEFTVRSEAAQPARGNIQTPAAPAEAPKLAIVTTDPIASIQLQQLPPRINAIEKIVGETTPDRPKAETAHDSTNAADTSAGGQTGSFADTTPGAPAVEQARPAHHVEIPQMPHVQVVRTVSMEVGDPGSQVTVRIQERAGDISMQINAASEPLHQDLQSSVGSLVHSLKQEHVPVSNVEVSRKSPIDKVRRMKEAH